MVKINIDILFLDIVMEPFSGLELAKKLRARGDASKMIFITSHEQYAIDAYDVQAYHYLTKPVDIKKMEDVLLKLCGLLKEEYGRAITIRQGAAVRRVLNNITPMAAEECIWQHCLKLAKLTVEWKILPIFMQINLPVHNLQI